MQRNLDLRQLGKSLSVVILLQIGVSAQSLYKWVKAASPTDEQKDKAELIEVKRENLRLRAELARAQEEREILKKAAAYFARQPE